MVRDFRGGERSCHPGNLCHLAGDEIQTALPFLVQRLVIFLQIRFQSLDHPDDFLFPHFLAAAEGVFVRTIVQQGVGDQIFFADEQTRALRPANRFSTAEGDEVVAHVCVIPQVRNGRRIRGGVDERGNLIFMRQLDPFFDFDLPFRIREV